MHRPRSQKVKDQGHTVTKTISRMVASAATGMCLHVDTTAYVF